MLFFDKLRQLVKPAPNAAKAYQQAGGQVNQPYWLFAAPVHLLLGRDSYFMHTPAPLTLSPQETAQLITDLNHHFADDGLYFEALHDVWFLGLATNPQISTTPLNQVIGKEVSAYLPTGTGALVWAAFQNELQMLLFTHPVNQAREARGELVINSLWCYGLASA